jgi:hypothetical protein
MHEGMRETSSLLEEVLTAARRRGRLSIFLRSLHQDLLGEIDSLLKSFDSPVKQLHALLNPLQP